MGLSFPFPFIDVLTIPTDAGPGEPRIVIDGLTGEITIYDNNGDLYASITPTGGFEVFDPGDPGQLIQINIVGGLPTLLFATGDPLEGSQGRIIGVISGAGATRNATVDIASGDLGGDRGRIVLISESANGAEPSRIFLDAEELSVEPNMVQAAAGPVGTIVGKIEVFSGTSGTTIGFLPLYDTIT